MFAEKLETVTIFEDNDPNGLGAWFPGAVKLSDSRLLATFSLGEEFEGRHQMACSISTDDGKSWQFAGTMFNGIACGNLKPTALKDGSLIAVGYGFDPVNGVLVNGKTGGLAPGANYAAFADGNARNWSMPQKINTGMPEVLETSGPCLELDNGDLISACTPFPMWDGSMPSCRKGYILRSCDKGKTWQKSSIFFETVQGNVAPYETRLAKLPDNRIIIMIWCLDEKIGKSLNNHTVYSDDNGFTWSAPIDTGMPAQASNIFPLPDNTLLAIHCVREGNCGVYLNHAEISEGKWKTLHSEKIWCGENANKIGSLADMGDSLKFGQPSITALEDGTFLIIHWAMSGRKGKILGHRVKINF